jgi:signal peptidase I
MQPQDQDTVRLDGGSGGGGGGTPPGDGPAQNGGPDEPGGRGKEKKKGSFWKELPILIVVALVLTFLIQTFIARVYIIPSGSMEQTLHGCTGCTGDRILVDKVIYNFHDPEPGDVVVFRAPNGWARSEFQVDQSENSFVHWLKEFGAAVGLGPPQEYDLVKRVIAVGGQTVSCCDAQHRVQVDGKSLHEPYVYWQPGTGGPSDERNDFEPVRVPKNTVWVMGDNRNNSFDSRFQNGGGINGVVPLDNVIGKARTIIWPPGRWSGISDDNPQSMAVAEQYRAPGWQDGLPAGIGIAAAFPVLWLGRRAGSLVRLPVSRRRR